MRLTIFRSYLQNFAHLASTFDIVSWRQVDISKPNNVHGRHLSGLQYYLHTIIAWNQPAAAVLHVEIYVAKCTNLSLVTSILAHSCRTRCLCVYILTTKGTRKTKRGISTVDYTQCSTPLTFCSQSSRTGLRAAPKLVPKCQNSTWVTLSGGPCTLWGPLPRNFLRHFVVPSELYNAAKLQVYIVSRFL